MNTKNNNKKENEQEDGFDQSDEAKLAALMEIIKYIAYECAKRDYMEFYTRFLESLERSAEGEKNDS